MSFEERRRLDLYEAAREHFGDEPAATLTDSGFQAFVRKNCFTCHDDKTAEAKLSLESLALPGAEFTRWIPIYDKLRAGEMPPKDAPQPSPEERRRAAEWLKARLQEASSAQQRSEGRVVLRLRPYQTFHSPPRHVHQASDLNEKLLHGLGDSLPW